MENFWPACLSRFEKELSAQQFNTWIKPLYTEIEGDAVRVFAPNRFVMQWVKDRFLKKIEQYAQELLLPNIQIELLLGEANTKITNDKSNDKPEIIKPKTDAKSDYTPSDFEAKIKSSRALTSGIKVKKNNENSGLNPSFNFSNYVTGRANQLARAAAIQVAENPGAAYNPLFIYGGVGLGKTHLLQAIGNELKSHHPDAKIRYLHAERYVSDVVKAYEHKAFDEFKRQYHSLDLLLIDDIQFFAKKTRTQEEFFYAFNSLIEAKKQIVITCDTYPKEIIDVDERLRTRFSWGLTVAVEPPELEMRVAILLKKAEAVNLNLPEDVAFFIAKQIRSSVRELEGALNRIIAMAKFTGHAIDVHLAKDALRDLIAIRGRQVTMENIQKTVADYYKIKVAEMYSKKRTRNFARPRQIAMALSRELTNHSFPEIGEAFGGRHHTTVMHACDEIDSLRQNDPSVARDIGFLVQVIRD
ncbi:MAG: chromosomal replication initiator protein DnaA [Methylotenera sp.]|nr:chromosomal replication initiator protein DnaA [Methylotenera sp.]MDP1755489.1 chromosomal replication initiator protein DnaA [Methylotenera sp.]MDP1958677.1 chromosomal replication initiator protein DnaA [Methylotenera sp.]MDP3206449.1 chromosomal replication initiator protein DnaA [Methylotenera sp.]MDP3302694.1 chromosomal replication initiator protein DnaA [Methylotenera sp.]